MKIPFMNMTLIMLCFLFPSMGLADAHESAGQADASKLLSKSQRAVGQVVRAAQANPKMAVGNASSKPFWDAMKEVNEALDKAQTGLTLKDDTFFSNLATFVR